MIERAVAGFVRERNSDHNDFEGTAVVALFSRASANAAFTRLAAKCLPHTVSTHLQHKMALSTCKMIEIQPLRLGAIGMSCCQRLDGQFHFTAIAPYLEVNRMSQFWIRGGCCAGRVTVQMRSHDDFERAGCSTEW